MKHLRRLLDIGLVLFVGALVVLVLHTVPFPTGDVLRTTDTQRAAPLRYALDWATTLVNDKSATPRLGQTAAVPLVYADSPERTWVDSQLVLQSAELNVWLQDGLVVEQETLEQIAISFHERSLPVLQTLYPQETATLGNESRLNVAIAGIDGALGYFSSWTSPYSPDTAVDVPVILSIAASPGSPKFDSVLAHEVGHYLQWLADEDEDTWINEGLSSLIEDLCGYTYSQRHAVGYGFPADTQLNTWGGTDTSPHYAVSFAFMRYLHDRYGLDSVQAIAHASRNGVPGVLEGLGLAGISANEDDLLAGWALANIAAAVNLPDKGYQDMAPGVLPLSLPAQTASLQRQTAQYATAYYQIDSRTPTLLTVEGSKETPLMPRPTTNSRVWWSGLGDRQSSWFELELDLTTLQAASLTFDLWYALEERWDWAYILVAPKDSEAWVALRTGGMQLENPENGWPGYTGLSGLNGQRGAWIHETVDLGAYRGQKIRLRLQYETDDAVNMGGLAIAEMKLNEESATPEGEEGRSRWHSEGFQHVWPWVEQHYIAQMIYPELGLVERIELADNAGELLLTPDKGATAFLAVTPTARWTTYPAEYTLGLEYLN